jgi:hypothetical protein
MASLASKIKQWKLDKDRVFDVVAWESDGYRSIQSYNQTMDTLKTNTGTHNTEYYMRFNDVDEPCYIHPYSVGLHPLADWRHIDRIKNEYENYCAANLLSQLTRPEMRLFGAFEVSRNTRWRSSIIF